MEKELKNFILLAMTTKAGYTGEKIDGLSVQELKDAGISDSTINWLSKNHYIAIHKDKPIWISWTNKYYPSRTIDGLKSLIKKYEKEMK